MKKEYIIPSLLVQELEEQDLLMYSNNQGKITDEEAGNDPEEIEWDAKGESVWDQVWNRSYEFGSH